MSSLDTVVAAPARLDERSIRKVALTALAGTSIEWYDFFLYGTAAALVFPTAFFPAGMPPAIALLASFSTFAVGFIARPVGGIIFGHYGDRLGRKKALVVALVLMGAATTLIGCLPTYASIGAAAPLLLIVLRFAQGIAIGGQWGGAVLIATENAPPERRGFYGSFAQVGAPVGVILANLAFLLMSANTSPDAFMQWGWRVPFVRERRAHRPGAVRAVATRRHRRVPQVETSCAAKHTTVGSATRLARRCSKRCAPIRNRSRSQPARSSPCKSRSTS